MKGKKSPWITALLLTALIAAAVSQLNVISVFAAGTGKTVQLINDTNFSGGISNQDHIYLGTKNETDYIWTDEAPYWRVLDAGRMNTGSPGMFLRSENLVGNKDTSLDGFIRYSIPFFRGRRKELAGQQCTGLVQEFPDKCFFSSGAVGNRRNHKKRWALYVY